MAMKLPVSPAVSLAYKFIKMKAARSATAGGQQFPVHWGGDCSANYNSMAETLRGGLSLGLSGFGFWSHDIGGFENTATPDLYKRWAAFGLLSSHSRLHGSQSYRVPWLFDEEACDVLRYFTKLKSTLMPYLFSTSVETTQTGLPVMRAMVLEFMEDTACEQIDRQYMLGESLMVAPIFNDQGIAKYYLPEGRWTNFLNGSIVEGGRWIHEQHDYFGLPLMVRPNSIVAVGSNDLRPDYDYASGVVLHVFELEDGHAASTTVYNMKGEPELGVNAQRSGRRIDIIANGTDKPWELIIRGLQEVEAVAGASWTVEETGIRLIPQEGVRKLSIQLKP
jgi:alpha-D-xyloside xylohydrolase